MKLLLLSDIHARTKATENRTDIDFLATIIGKLEQVFEIAKKEGCTSIIQAGDLFDSPSPSKFLMRSIIRLFKSHIGIPVYMCLGQHDIAFRNFEGYYKSAPALIEAADAVTVVGITEVPVMLSNDIVLHGISFGQEYIPKVVSGCFNILVAHVSVGTSLQEYGFSEPRSYLRKHKEMDLILVGDYHYTFHDNLTNRHIFNTGCLIRKTIADIEHKPCVFVFDTDTREYKQIFLTIQPAELAFDLTNVKKEDNNHLLAFATMLKEKNTSAASFEKNLLEYYQQHEVSDVVKSTISEFFVDS